MFECSIRFLKKKKKSRSNTIRQYQLQIYLISWDWFFDYLNFLIRKFCFCEDLILENCTMSENCDLCFEYSILKADIHSVIKSIKNPTSGEIVADDYEEIIFDDNVKAPNNCIISKRANKSEKRNRFQVMKKFHIILRKFKFQHFVNYRMIFIKKH